jgi:hypothetical protein
MKNIKAYEEDLSSIRSMMERSVKFISLSGLSGVMAGIYAFSGSAVAFWILQSAKFDYRSYDDGDAVGYSTDEISVAWKLLFVASLVLTASLVTGIWFSHRKAKKYNLTLWNTTSQRLFASMAIPLVTGGLFVLIVLYMGYYGLAAPATLIFYGLALIHGSQYTYDEVRYLGFSEIILGLIAVLLPGYGLIFWAFGFGVLHLVYGALMHYRHDQ